MNNPFELTFGLKPNNYISRLKQSEEIISNFKSITGNKIFYHWCKGNWGFSFFHSLKGAFSTL